jgi:2-keto-3-deoxy-L-rhamnonate aldolase RhmA
VKPNTLKQKLEGGEVAVVVNPDHPSPSLAEFVGGLGVDGVFIDCEHGMVTIERASDMCQAARAAGVPAIVRPETRAHWVLNRYLDAGADGLMVPHVDTAAEAAEVVKSVRSIRYRDYATKAIIVMIESVQAVTNLDAILAVEGIDVFFVGPDDLSRSMGLPGQMEDPRAQAKISEAISRIRGAGRVPGTLVTENTAAEFVAQGCRYLYEHLGNFCKSGCRNFYRRLRA